MKWDLFVQYDFIYGHGHATRTGLAAKNRSKEQRVISCSLQRKQLIIDLYSVLEPGTSTK
jgi:hypothetical protein